MRVLARRTLILAAPVAFIALALPKFAAAANPYIPVISKGFQHQFWQTVKKGAEDASKKYGVDITFEGPPTEADIQPQVQMLVNAMAKNPSAVCLAALDTSSVMDQLNEAMRRKIPIIGFDSGVPNAPKGSIHATASTDNAAAAGLAAEKMFAALKSKVEAASAAKPVTFVVFSQDATSQSVTYRGKGFRDRLLQLITTQTGHKASDIKVRGNPAYVAAGNPTGGKAIIIDMVVPASPKDTDAANTAHAILNRVKSENVVGIFCSNEGTARALLSSTNDGSALPTQYPGMLVVGFDAGKAQKAAVRNKYFFGAITQDPYQIGFKAVELAFKAIKKEPVADVDTGAKFYDSSNMDEKDIALLLYD
jgi:ribose transport system substrate-binding protein